MQRTDTIGLLVPDITNPFSAEVARGVENAAQEFGLTLILGDTNYSPELESQYIRRLGSNRVDGLLIMPVSSNAKTEVLDTGIPSVILNTKNAADSTSFVTIEITNWAVTWPPSICSNWDSDVSPLSAGK